MAKTRLVVIHDEYLDGITAANVSDASEFTGPTARRVPVEVIAAYDAAWDAMRAAEKKLWLVYGALPDVRNPHNVEPADPPKES